MANDAAVGAAFREGFVEAGGFRIRYMEAGQGPPLVHLHGAGGLRLSPGHDLLSRQFRVIAFEIPGFGVSPENRRSATIQDLAATMADAIAALGITQCALWGSSFGGKVSLWLTIQRPALVQALVLEAPAAIRPEGAKSPSGTPAEIARRLYAHPDRMPPFPAVDPVVGAKMQTLVGRLRGPDRDAALEAKMREMALPVLVLFGTRDGVIPPTMGRFYKELIPGSHLAFVYDAGHVICAERPEAFAEITADFLQRLDAFVIASRPTMIHA